MAFAGRLKCDGTILADLLRQQVICEIMSRGQEYVLGEAGMRKSQPNKKAPRGSRGKRPDILGARTTSKGLGAGERFYALGGFTGRMESLQEGTAAGAPKVPDAEDIARMAGALSTAAREDPGAFGVLSERPSEGDLRELLSDTFTALRQQGPKAPLSAPQRSALEAIIRLRGRPALLVRDDTFVVPEGAWEMLAPFRPDMSTVLKSVCRIEIAEGYPELPYAGTGFVIGKNLVMTNAHVAEVFAAKAAGGWRIKPSMKIMIDFKEEFGSAARAEFPIVEIVGIHKTLDLALLKANPRGTPGHAFPKPLSVQKDSGFVAAGNNVYTAGYPASDSSRNDPTQMHRIYGGIYEKKRLSPGRIMAASVANKDLSHDCSTLGGNSGSCVADLATHTVVGLHHGGRYREANHAVLLPTLVNDPMLAAVNFR
ncbi:trypsin-like peptidase domain-containing protein [Vineibacter terrae]|uniref:Trypsin-like peptidase domain-containing protein n=1 Tax=Vineibacter terrae TaxID=2586908 RepID=A0A5C8PRW2_9HYPH|nr:serine protease [Vineibacter terrae]TXL79470.1 trypsin-like peptidase domain-containing protein [Vineibacter terrae]